MPAPDAARPPIQPVSRPILCHPWDEPTAHWVYDTATGEASPANDRRPASYFYGTHRTGSAQLQMGFVAEEERDDLPLVNALRADVKKWRESGWESSTPATKQLLRHWTRADRPRRLFFCRELDWLNAQVRPDITDLEKRHREGYVRIPVQPGEFDVWESEQSWGDE